MMWEGRCDGCEEIVEYMSNRADRDLPRTHAGEDQNVQCPGQLVRVPYPRRFAVKWHYGKGDKKGCFMGPSNNIYKTDAIIKRDAAKTRTVHGPSYSGDHHKDKS